MVAGFVLAMIVNKGIHWKGAIRGMVFLPYVSNMVAVAVVFKILFGQSGPFYQIMQFLGVENPPLLLLSDKFALPTVALIAVWKGIGLNMITYLGALQNVPTELDEAAQIDGANKWQRIKNVVTDDFANNILLDYKFNYNIITELYRNSVFDRRRTGSINNGYGTKHCSYCIRTE